MKILKEWKNPFFTIQLIDDEYHPKLRGQVK